jgi:hypothetical protein
MFGRGHAGRDARGQRGFDGFVLEGEAGRSRAAARRAWLENNKLSASSRPNSTRKAGFGRGHEGGPCSARPVAG